MACYLRQLVKIVPKDSILSNINVPLVHNVRFRKPRWVPIAKSKEFYVRKPTPIDPEEYEELKPRYMKYKADVESIRLFLKTQLSGKEVDLVQKQETDEKAEMMWVKEQVEEWNNFVGLKRSERQAMEEVQIRKRIELLMKEQAEQRLQRAIEAEQILLKNKAVVSDFVTPDKLDEAIEKMLDSRSDYNFAITKSGEVLSGEYPDRSEKINQPKRKADSPT